MRAARQIRLQIDNRTVQMAIDTWTFWLILGLLGQACFFARFLFQWLASERCGESVIPESFWWFSLIVFILGQSFGSIVYLRNLHFIRRKKQ